MLYETTEQMRWDWVQSALSDLDAVEARFHKDCMMPQQIKVHVCMRLYNDREYRKTILHSSMMYSRVINVQNIQWP